MQGSAAVYDRRVADVREGTLIGGKYLVEARVGEGAMGEVYRARNVDIDRIVAIKLLSDRHADDEIAVKRFLREAKNATLVRHPNVVDVIDLGQDDRGIPYMVQDFLSGEDLRSHLRKRGGRIPAADAIAIMRPIAHALAAAHAQGVVHRDVKPGNIFLANERGAVTPKLVDFGISRMASPDETATMTGTLVGTPAYMAPEQIHDPNRIGPATDVWAFGVVLFELVCGRRPFEEANVGALYVAISQAPVPRMDQLAFEAPRELADIVARCVERDLARRIPNGAELVAALDGPELRAALSRPPPPELAGRHASGRMQAVRPSGEIALDLPIPGTPTVPVPAQQAAVPELDLPRRSRNDLRAVSLEHKLGIHASPTCVMSFGENDACVGELSVGHNMGLRVFDTAPAAKHNMKQVELVGDQNRAPTKQDHANHHQQCAEPSVEELSRFSRPAPQRQGPPARESFTTDQ